MATKAEEWIRASETLEIANPASLSVVCFRFNPKGRNLSGRELEALNERIQERVIETGTAMMSSTRLRGEYSLRLCIVNYTTTWDDVCSTLEAIERFGLDALSDG